MVGGINLKYQWQPAARNCSISEDFLKAIGNHKNIKHTNNTKQMYWSGIYQLIQAGCQLTSQCWS